MFDAIRFWSRRKSVASQVSARLPYPPDLHARMQDAHLRLVEAFEQARASHRSAELDDCAGHLRRFERQLRSYLDGEQLQFQEYLQQRQDGEHGRIMLMRQTRARLRQLARETGEMLRPANPDSVQVTQRIDFTASFDIIACILTECLTATELELMPHCLPPSAEGGLAISAAGESAPWPRVASR